MVALAERYVDATRTNKRALSKLRSRVSEVPLTDPCILLPNKKKPGIANEVDEFYAANWYSKTSPKLLLIEQDKSLAQGLKVAYWGEQIPVFHCKLSRFTQEYAGKISYMHADYCATVNQEAEAVLYNLWGKLADGGAVLRFTHSRRNNYKIFHLKESRALLEWLMNQKAISRKVRDNLSNQALTFQTDPTLRVGIQLITHHVMNTNTVRHHPQLTLEPGSKGYEIVDCVVDKYQDTGAPMQTMRFVLKPTEVDVSHVISSIYTVYNALS